MDSYLLMPPHCPVSFEDPIRSTSNRTNTTAEVPTYVYSFK